jgi:hypothetical protein
MAQPDDARGPTGTRHINGIPSTPPVRFCDRGAERELLRSALANPRYGLVVVSGPDGVGKTEVIRNLRDQLSDPKAPDVLDAFVYLSAYSYRRFTVSSLLNDLAKAVKDDEGRGRAAATLQRAIPWVLKADGFVKALAETRAVVTIDNADALFDDDGALHDRDLREVIGTFVGKRDKHGVRFVVVVQDARVTLPGDLNDSIQFVPVDHGFDEKNAVDYLQSLDTPDAPVLARTAPAEIERLVAAAEGRPRALELTFGLLRAQPAMSMTTLLDELEDLPYDRLSDASFAEALEQRDRAERSVVAALAVYGRPVRAYAVTDLLGEAPRRVPGILRSLHDLRLIRRDRDRYYLPPGRDGDLALRRFAKDVNAGNENTPLEPWLTALYRKAADYYAGQQVRPVRNLDDLDPYFSEIELRMRSRQYSVAFEVMQDLDNRYLRGWGHSDALIDWRNDLRNVRMGRAQQAANLSQLVEALQQQEEEPADVDGLLQEAFRHVRRFGAPDKRLTLTLQVAGAHFDAGEYALAKERYRTVIRMCRATRVFYKLSLYAEEAEAHSSLANTLANSGYFGEAEHEFVVAEACARRLSGDEHSAAEALRLLNLGWMRAQLGHRGDARVAVQRAAAKGKGSRPVLFQGLCLDAEAAILIDDKQPHEAVRLAAEAAGIGARERNIGLFRDANTTLALARLELGHLENAATAADDAVRHDRGAKMVGAWGLRGILAYLLDNNGKASDSFRRAKAAADQLIDRDKRAYQLFEEYAVVLCGVALCGLEPPEATLRKAVKFAEDARTIAPTASGAILRSERLLTHLGHGEDKDKLAPVRWAVGGEQGSAGS